MSRSRGSLAAHSLLAATAAGTTWIAMSAWRGFSEEPGGYLNPLLLLALVVAATGVAARWWRWPGVAVVSTQVVVSGAMACLLLTGRPLPIGDTWVDLRQQIDQALQTAQDFAAPVPTQAPPIDAILVLCGLLCLLMVDLLACTLRRVPLSGLPLLTIYSIPISMVAASVSWWIFAATAAGFLTMLFLQESEQVGRWGRPLGVDRETGDPISFGAGAHVTRGAATTVGGMATALAVLVPAIVPTLGFHVFDFGPGDGGGDQIQIKNPTADLVRDFRAGEDTPLVQVTTTDPDPSYLRILTLTRFSDVEWSPGDRNVPADQNADGLMPPPQGLDTSVDRKEIPYDVTVLPGFESMWLPTEYPVSRVQAEGDWRYDTSTMDFLAVPEDLTTAGLHYTMTEIQPHLTAQEMLDAGPAIGQIKQDFTDLPDDMPPMIHDLAFEVTDGLRHPFERAVALQNFFREDGGFEYTLSTEEGNGYDALVRFLTPGPEGRRGYCEQFASAMAVMARELSIPARVAIGFLKPSPAGQNTWVYSTNDLHAWPELYIDGAGWVRFEPTPSGRAEEVPSYTTESLIDNNNEPTPGQTRSASAGTVPTNRPTETPGAGADAGTGGGSVTDSTWLPVGGALLAVLLVVGGLLTPRALRSRRRDRRLASGDPELIWLELRETAADLAVPWPPGRSPRATRDVLVDFLGLPVTPSTPERPPHGPEIAPEAVGALDRIVGVLERLRYSRTGSEEARVSLRADAETCLASLAGGAARSARRRATWWPRSVTTFRLRTARPTPATVEARYGGVVDHVG